MAVDIDLTSLGATDVGQVRSANQDSFYADDKQRLYLVADGMGGHAGGEIASGLCVDIIPLYVKDQEPLFEQCKSHPDQRIANALASSINFASTKIYEKALENPKLKGMGTTATVLKITGNYAYIAHVGDSRCYLVRCGYIYQITNDHSLVSEQVRAGILSKEEAEQHHLRNVITRSVGYQEEEDVDTTSFELEDGDLILLCSDGLHGKVPDKEISLQIQNRGTEAVPGLITTANQRGGEDNITGVIVKVSAK
jgi:serine/threonine protein phosphatase PrpC